MAERGEWKNFAKPDELLRYNDLAASKRWVSAEMRKIRVRCNARVWRKENGKG